MPTSITSKDLVPSVPTLLEKAKYMGSIATSRQSESESEKERERERSRSRYWATLRSSKGGREATSWQRMARPEACDWRRPAKAPWERRQTSTQRGRHGPGCSELLRQLADDANEGSVLLLQLRVLRLQPLHRLWRHGRSVRLALIRRLLQMREDAAEHEEREGRMKKQEYYYNLWADTLKKRQPIEKLSHKNCHTDWKRFRAWSKD